MDDFKKQLIEFNVDKKDQDFKSSDDTSKKIIQILDDYVKPAVASDGGNILFDSYNKKSKVVNVILQGACSGCPSSTVTLKNGIETMLKSELPGKISNVAVPSDAAMGYAPDGQSLICVSTKGIASLEEILSELRSWFGSTATSFRFLKQYSVPEALPRQLPGDNGYGKNSAQLDSGLWICGDYRYSASIQGAMASGRKVAEAISQKS